MKIVGADIVIKVCDDKGNDLPNEEYICPIGLRYRQWGIGKNQGFIAIWTSGGNRLLTKGTVEEMNELKIEALMKFKKREFE